MISCLLNEMNLNKILSLSFMKGYLRKRDIKHIYIFPYSLTKISYRLPFQQRHKISCKLEMNYLELKIK